MLVVQVVVELVALVVLDHLVLVEQEQLILLTHLQQVLEIVIIMLLEVEEVEDNLKLVEVHLMVEVVMVH